MSRYEAEAGQPRPLWKVILLSTVTGLFYYGYYKWIIQEELRQYRGDGWSGSLCLAPFIIGLLLPQALRIWDPDVPGWFGWFSLLGIVWIYIVQFRLYHTVNQLYEQSQLQPPLTVWWLFVPGLNLIVGLRQIHFLSRYWAYVTQTESPDPVADRLPFVFGYPSF